MGNGLARYRWMATYPLFWKCTYNTSKGPQNYFHINFIFHYTFVQLNHLIWKVFISFVLGIWFSKHIAISPMVHEIFKIKCWKRSSPLPSSLWQIWKNVANQNDGVLPIGPCRSAYALRHNLHSFPLPILFAKIFLNTCYNTEVI